MLRIPYDVCSSLHVNEHTHYETTDNEMELYFLFNRMYIKRLSYTNVRMFQGHLLSNIGMFIDFYQVHIHVHLYIYRRLVQADLKVLCTLWAKVGSGQCLVLLFSSLPLYDGKLNTNILHSPIYNPSTETHVMFHSTYVHISTKHCA